MISRVASGNIVAMRLDICSSPGAERRGRVVVSLRISPLADNTGVVEVLASKESHHRDDGVKANHCESGAQSHSARVSRLGAATDEMSPVESRTARSFCVRARSKRVWSSQGNGLLGPMSEENGGGMKRFTKQGGFTLIESDRIIIIGPRRDRDRCSIRGQGEGLDTKEACTRSRWRAELREDQSNDTYRTGQCQRGDLIDTSGESYVDKLAENAYGNAMRPLHDAAGGGRRFRLPVDAIRRYLRLGGWNKNADDYVIIVATRHSCNRGPATVISTCEGAAAGPPLRASRGDVMTSSKV